MSGQFQNPRQSLSPEGRCLKQLPGYRQNRPFRSRLHMLEKQVLFLHLRLQEFRESLPAAHYLQAHRIRLDQRLQSPLTLLR